MFIDEVVLTLESGAGGDGCSAFRREKYVPRGGPAGGDGGRGGDVVLRVDAQLTTLRDMEQDRTVRAEPGEPGRGGNQHGADGAHRVLLVPPGTTVKDAETGTLLADLLEPGQSWVAARGGRGGFGNSRFATATDQAPTRWTPGEPATVVRVRLELRLIADVGLVGMPNAGKSTLLSRLSRATPRIADYPFTTLEPYLGIVELPGFRRFVLADLPGLIEGAHEGKGLGDRFLRHVERTRVLLHLVDLFPPQGSAREHYRAVRRELAAYGHGLGDRPEIVAGTKADLAPPGEAAAAAQRLSRAIRRPVLVVSGVSGAGLHDLVKAVGDALGRLAAPAPRPRARRAKRP
jgi:GTP-binding protein